jgi:hypothetical protein
MYEEIKKCKNMLILKYVLTFCDTLQAQDVYTRTQGYIFFYLGL